MNVGSIKPEPLATFMCDDGTLASLIEQFKKFLKETDSYAKKWILALVVLRFLQQCHCLMLET
jgi:hypothetical protein